VQILYIPALAAFGVLILTVAWLPRVIERLPVSLPMICVAAGWVLFSVAPAPIHLDLAAGVPIIEHGSELIVLVALMGAGLKLDRPVGLKAWGLTWRLLGVAMPLTILGVALAGYAVVGLAPAAALLLGAALAPTDPVLASDVQVGPPKSGEVDDVRFSLTSEAGLNDALAFPFVNLAIALALAAGAAPDWAEWLRVDVAWKLAAGLGVGWLSGWLLGRVTFGLPDRAKLSATGDGFVALGGMLLAYGAAELIQGYGFLSVFVASVTLRAAEPEHDFHLKMHDFMDQLERLLTMFALVLFGGALAGGLLRGLTPPEAAAALLLLFAVRPLSGFLAMMGSGRPALERRLIAFFGIRGIGTVYYLTHAFGAADFPEAPVLWRLCGLIILLSVLLHGTTATPMMRRLDAEALRRRRRVEIDGA